MGSAVPGLERRLSRALSACSGRPHNWPLVLSGCQRGPIGQQHCSWLEWLPSPAERWRKIVRLSGLLALSEGPTNQPCVNPRPYAFRLSNPPPRIRPCWACLPALRACGGFAPAQVRALAERLGARPPISSQIGWMEWVAMARLLHRGGDVRFLALAPRPLACPPALARPARAFAAHLRPSCARPFARLARMPDLAPRQP